MAKRRLNEHQLRRISSQQKARGKPAGPAARGTDSDHANDESTLGPEQEGLIVCHYGQQLDVESLSPASKGQLFRCHQRSNLPPLVTGDKVIWQAEGDSTGIIVALVPRHSAMSRPNARGEQRSIAANIDRVVVVFAPVPEPFGNLLDRYLVAIEHLRLKPLLLLNKCDLMPAETSNESADAAALKVSDLLKLYAGIGYETLRVSCHQPDSIDSLRNLLKDETAVFVGQSGVGKSSLINTLRGIDDDDNAAGAADVGGLSKGRAVGREKGTHTTTATKLYHLPGSGDLVDSPGIREFGLWHIEAEQLMYGFVEFRPYIGQCRFRDCRHQQEPGCALLAAVKKGKIHASRLNSYHHILQELGRG